MSFPTSDPYASPSGMPPKPSMEPARMRYMESFQYIFAHPEWTMNVLLASVCSLIPIIGNIILLGYQYEIVESMHRFPGQLYPKFDFNRFTQYLVRGVWPFLVSFIVGVVMQIPIQCANFGLMGIGAAAGGRGRDEAAGIAMLLGLFVLFIFIVVLVIALSLVMVPVLLRAGLSQDFVKAFNFAWIKDFLAKTWLETVLASLFMMVAGTIVAMAGLAACCIGIIPASVIIIMAYANLLSQLYTIYLARGGEPIPLKPWDGPAPMVPAAV